MVERPKLNIELTSTDKAIEALGWIGLVLFWGLTIISYGHLPDIIPTHYNIEGQADGFGAKDTIWLLPTITTLLFVGLTILNNFPHTFNYPTKITEDNAKSQYTNATRLIRYLKLVMVVIFGLIALSTFLYDNASGLELGKWLWPLILLLIAIPLLIFTIKSFNIQKVKR